MRWSDGMNPADQYDTKDKERIPGSEPHDRSQSWNLSHEEWGRQTAATGQKVRQVAANYLGRRLRFHGDYQRREPAALTETA